LGTAVGARVRGQSWEPMTRQIFRFRIPTVGWQCAEYHRNVRFFALPLNKHIQTPYEAAQRLLLRYLPYEVAPHFVHLPTAQLHSGSRRSIFSDCQSRPRSRLCYRCKVFEASVFVFSCDSGLRVSFTRLPGGVCRQIARARSTGSRSFTGRVNRPIRAAAHRETDEQRQPTVYTKTARSAYL
jgi:hypothetical protein